MTSATVLFVAAAVVAGVAVLDGTRSSRLLPAAVTLLALAHVA